MRKLLIISGLAGSSKQEVAKILSRQMKTKVLPADSLQVYKNWPISTNWPNDLSNYELIGKYDGFSNLLTCFQVKSEVIQTLNKIENPIIEGGCCFFINQLLKARHEQFSELEIQIADQKAKEMFLNCQDAQTLLKSLCKKYNGQFIITDKYRMIKAIRNALLTNGETFQSTFNINEPKLSEIFDVRGFFLSESQENICKKIYKRCDDMLKQGVLKEFYEFYLLNKNINLYQVRHSTPIGYNLFVEMIKSFNLINENTQYSQSRKESLKRVKVRNFIEKFYINSRQYTSYQRRYVRSNLNQFIWIDNGLKNIPEMISSYYYCDRQLYENELNSIVNIALKSEKYSESQGQQMKMEICQEIQELVYETMQNMIFV
ncbi:unnamed protein product [Paramecium sonneborni]|uniref:Uncharacterized protein n=1 Tax=Paramecium sonneborni TaxID=65129 RepID=A0A8S1QE30_9CILI|nr:unnamed protein product [Paramecium sonneborni]